MYPVGGSKEGSGSDAVDGIIDPGDDYAYATGSSGVYMRSDPAGDAWDDSYVSVEAPVGVSSV